MRGVLPAPLVPMSPTTSPGRTSRLTPFTANTPPKRTLTSSVRRGSAVDSASPVRSRVERSATSDDARPFFGSHPVRRGADGERGARPPPATRDGGPGHGGSQDEQPEPAAHRGGG